MPGAIFVGVACVPFFPLSFSGYGLYLGFPVLIGGVGFGLFVLIGGFGFGFLLGDGLDGFFIGLLSVLGLDGAESLTGFDGSDPVSGFDGVSGFESLSGGRKYGLNGIQLVVDDIITVITIVVISTVGALVVVTV